MEEKKFDLKQSYDKLAQKHNLPEFRKLSEDFDIEVVGDKEPIFLIREIRRAINKKLSAYLQLFENLINPNSPPIFVFSILKNVSEEDRHSMKNIYEKLSLFQIEVMKLDTIYDEDKEVKFISDVYKAWQNLKFKIYNIMDNFKEDSENKNKTTTSYFG